MQLLWRSLRWFVDKLVFLFVLLLASLMLLMVQSVFSVRLAVENQRVVPVAALGLRQWWAQVVGHLRDLVHGHIAPATFATKADQLMWQKMPSQVIGSLAITGKIVGTALVVGLVLGLLAGWLSSRLAPRLLRRSTWGLIAALACLPDLLIATVLDLALVLFGAATGHFWKASDLVFYQHFLAPVLALTLLVIPYVARVTAGAIEEVSRELYIRTAVAKGLSPKAVAFKHMGRAVLIRVWTTLPVIMGLLISGTAVVEYIMEIDGLGRELVLTLAPTVTLNGKDPYVGFPFLLTLLVMYAVVAALSESGLRRLDPRLQAAAAETASAAGKRRGGLRDLWQGLAAFPGDLWQWLKDVPTRLWFTVQGWPRKLRSAGRGLKDPVLVLGLLLVAALLVVAMWAPKIAPYNPNQKFLAFQDKAGHIWAPPFGPGKAHWLGTDDMGRDVASRLIYATRYALIFAGLAVPARFLLAVVLGLFAAWRGGFWSKAIERMGIFFTAVPQVLVPLAVLPMLARIFPPASTKLIGWSVFVIALPGIPKLALAIRQQALSVLALPFMEGARAVGASGWRTLWSYLLPQLAPHLITMLVLEVPSIMTLTATLSYFRIAIGGWVRDPEDPIGNPVIPEWGSMMGMPFFLIFSHQWWLWAPFVALLIGVVAFTLLGEGMRRVWTPRGEWSSGS